MKYNAENRPRKIWKQMYGRFVKLYEKKVKKMEEQGLNIKRRKPIGFQKFRSDYAQYEGDQARGEFTGRSITSAMIRDRTEYWSTAFARGIYRIYRDKGDLGEVRKKGETYAEALQRIRTTKSYGSTARSEVKKMYDEYMQKHHEKKIVLVTDSKGITHEKIKWVAKGGYEEEAEADRQEAYDEIKEIFGDSPKGQK